jgi:hypothetical protein
MYARFAAPKQLLWIEAADHFFAGGLGELEERVKASAEPFLPAHPVSDKTDTTEKYE